MTEEKKIEAYFERLEKLSTQELDQEAETCVLSEQRSVASLIAHLSEISKRKGHLELGYKDLFDYCVRRLGLSEGSVYLRLQVAGVARRFPQVLSLLAQNRISLSVAGMFARVPCKLRRREVGVYQPTSQGSEFLRSGLQSSDRG